MAVVEHLYVHIPFCHRICPYCGFYKHLPGKLANAAFVDAILGELDWRLDRDGVDLRLKTIYFGGGTPSLLTRSLLEKLCAGISGRSKLSEWDAVEWTIEANPATYHLEKMQLLRKLGVTRISLGVQSWTPHVLETLGRDHSPEQAREAFAILREADFESVSVDQMFSIPGQSLADFQSDLDQSIQLRPDHISCYNLTYEEDTEFLQRHQTGELNASEDRDATHFHTAIRQLADSGYRQYEISNYAADPRHESRHNRAYWSANDFLGLGPGAVSTINHQRWKTLPDTAAYVRAHESGLDVRTDIEALSPEDRRLEKIGMQIRTRDGLDLSLVEDGDPPFDLLENEGLIRREAGRLFLTDKGKPLADEIAAALL